MSRTGRLTATFVPLLSPTLQISLRSLAWLVRRPPAIRAPLRPQQCRQLHLYKLANAKTVLGQHKILPFSKYEPPPLDQIEHKINIVKIQSLEEGSETPGTKTLVAADLTPKEAYDRFLKPGQILTPAEDIKKQWVPLQIQVMQRIGTPEKFKDYVITEPYGPDVHVAFNGKKVKGQRADDPPIRVSSYNQIRQIRVMLHTPTHHWQTMLDKAYQFIELGCPVEFVLRPRISKETKKKKMENTGTELMDYLLSHFPHMRPDFILRSMPSGTDFIINPVTDGRALHFVLAIPNGRMPDLNKRLQNVKTVVGEAVKEGLIQRNLPRGLRSAVPSAILASAQHDPRNETAELESESHEPATAEEKRALQREWTLDWSRKRYMVSVEKDKTSADRPWGRKEAARVMRTPYKKGSGSIPPEVVEANRQRQKLNPRILSEEVVEANRQRQKAAAKKAREEAGAKKT